jgi:hypothetical protein
MPRRVKPIGVLNRKHGHPFARALPVPVGNLIRLASEAESRNVSIL